MICSVHAPPCVAGGESSYTVPGPCGEPPKYVVPKRFPPLSKITPEYGNVPSPPIDVKLWMTCSVHAPPVPGDSSNTVPLLALPPAVVVPYKLPLPSNVSPACG